jgi:hypothetical protein
LIDFRTSLAVFMNTPFGFTGRFSGLSDVGAISPLHFTLLRRRTFSIHKRNQAAEAALFLFLDHKFGDSTRLR